MRPMRQPCSVAPRQVDKVFLSTSSSLVNLMPSRNHLAEMEMTQHESVRSPEAIIG